MAAEARQNPRKRIIMKRMTQKDVEQNGGNLCDVELMADDMPIQVRSFDCMQCIHGSEAHNLTAVQMRDHITVFHVDRGDNIPGPLITWINRQANMFKKVLADLKKERQNA